MEEKANKTSEISKDNLNYFSFLSDQNGASKLIKSFYKFIKGYHDAYKNFHKLIIRVEDNFLKKDDFEPYVIETPFFKLGTEIKKILKVQSEKLESIFKNEIFALSTRLEILYHQLDILKSYDDNYSLNKNQLLERLNEFERKIIDNYIDGVYGKHIEVVSESTAHDIKLSIKDEQKKCLVARAVYKDDLVKNNNILIVSFNEMKAWAKKLILTLKENRKDDLDELERNE